MNAPQKYDHNKGRYLKYPPQNNNHVVPGVPKHMVQPLVTVKPASTSMQTSCLSPSENKAAKAPLAKSQENETSPGWGDVRSGKEGKNLGWGNIKQVDDKLGWKLVSATKRSTQDKSPTYISLNTSKKNSALDKWSPPIGLKKSIR